MAENTHAGHRKRIRGKILKTGFDSFFPHEILEYMLFGSVLQGDTNALAHKLMAKFGTLENVINASRDDLMQVDGVGEATAVLLNSYGYVAKMVNATVVEEKKKLMSLGAIRNYLMPFYRDKHREEFHVLLLDSHFLMQKHIVMLSPIVDKVYVDMNEVMTAIASFKPTAIVFSHNHPSGNPTPSKNDIAFTKKYFTAISLAFNVTISEHMIFTSDGNCYSFRNNGLLNKMIEDINEQNGSNLADNIELGGF